MTTIDHVLLTRFNLPSGGVEARIRASDEWLRQRLDLFERYCAPSVAAQTTPVQWIIYLDPESPRWLVDALEPYVLSGLLNPVYRAEVPPDALRSDLKAVSTGAETLATTNLDNDDGLAVNFSERLKDAVSSSEQMALYFVNGLIRSPTAAYAQKDRVNAFCSVVEPASKPVTCWVDWHNRLARHMPVTEVGGPPAWLQVIHDSNVSNRVRGRLIRPEPWFQLFPGALEDLTIPGSRSLVRDRLVSVPLRSARDAGRTALRQVAVATLGKEGMQRLKARVQR